jgi:hypothetical protein
MKDGSTKTLSSQRSSKLIDNYVKWKNRNFGPSQSKFKIFLKVKTLNKIYHICIFKEHVKSIKIILIVKDEQLDF